jgi:hypothetical protein
VDVMCDSAGAGAGFGIGSCKNGGGWAAVQRFDEECLTE